MDGSLVLFSSLLVLVSMGTIGLVDARAFFVFGDSLVDNGNNNYLVTDARADSPPYGIDFPNHQATGRFSNGLNIPDIISESLGAEYTLPYLSPQLTGQKLLVGANFASAGIGVLNDTGIQFASILRMSRQFNYFEEYQQRLGDLIGPQKAQQLVNQALVLITLGGNDFVNNYYVIPNSPRSRQFTLPEFVSFVISEYKKILMRLYDLGGRRVLVTGSGPLGCVPASLATRGRNGNCDPELTRVTELYNPQLETMLGELNKEIGADVFIAANTRLTQKDFITNPSQFGFITSKVACCGQGPYNGVGLCTVLSNLCPNRTVYAFWDPYHPTETANRLIVANIFHGSTDYMKPMNLSTILALDQWT